MSLPISRDAAQLAQAGHAKIMMCGRAAQEQNVEISALFMRVCGVSDAATQAQSRAMEGIAALTQGKPKGFFARMMGTPALPRPEEIRKRLDAIAVALTITEQALHKDSKRVALLGERLDKAEEMMGRAVGLLAEIRDGDGASQDAKIAAARRLAELAPSCQVFEHMRFTLTMVIGNIAWMRENTRTLLEDHLPVWDRLVDGLTQNPSDPEVARAFTEAAQKANAMLASPPVPGTNAIESHPSP